MSEFDTTFGLQPIAGAVKTASVPVLVLPSCIFIFVLVMYLLFSSGMARAAPEPLNEARRNELVRLVRSDCGSCHGQLLTGGLGPALTPEALKDKSDSVLVSTILYGLKDTPMPPWQPFMNEAEAKWIVENLKRGFPDEKSH